MIARILYYASFVVIAATVSIAGVRMWRDAHRKLAVLPGAVAIAPGGHVELGVDHVALKRVPGWRVTSPVAIESIEVVGSSILGRATGAVSSPMLALFDLATGTPKFTWQVPPDERWAVPTPTVVGSCIVTLTLRGDDAVARCLDANAGTPRWTAVIKGGRECIRAPIAVATAVVVQCSGWTTVIDSATGATTVDAGGISVVGSSLLRAGSPLTLAAWLPAQHRFDPKGAPVRGTDDFLSLSAVRRGDRLVLRAASSSEQVAIITPNVASVTGDVFLVAATDKRLADDRPLVADCGTGGPPRFQLIELAPKLGDHFDPNAAQQRALAFLDVDTGTIAWTSKMIQRANPVPALCRGSHYLVPIDLAGTSALWIVDAETGKTSRVLAGELGTLGPAQVDDRRLVGIGKDGAFELDWTTAPDARAGLEAVLGRLP